MNGKLFWTKMVCAHAFMCMSIYGLQTYFVLVTYSYITCMHTLHIYACMLRWADPGNFASHYEFHEMYSYQQRKVVKTCWFVLLIIIFMHRRNGIKKGNTFPSFLFLINKKKEDLICESWSIQLLFVIP